MESQYMPRESLLAGKWYVSNINPSKNGVQGIGVAPGKGYFNCVVGGPFQTESDAQLWLHEHPEWQGLYHKIIQCPT